jgi:protein-S-isoprenylcysteine O-methyltransferase Ste14
VTLVVIMWGAWLVVWCVLALGTRRGRGLERWPSRVAHFSVVGLGAAIVAVPRLGQGPLGWRIVPDGPGAFIAGAAVVAAGLGFSIWARVQLGRYWSGSVALKQGHKLIRSGPYAIVRHPIYTGAIAAVAGTAVVLGEARGVLALVLVTAAYIRKVVMEERVLAREFGEEHARYRRQVKALLPFIV